MIVLSNILGIVFGFLLIRIITDDDLAVVRSYKGATTNSMWPSRNEMITYFNHATYNLLS